MASSEHRKDRTVTLTLDAPRLGALRDEVSTLQMALRSIQSRVDPASVRLMRQFNTQLAASSAVLHVFGIPGSGTSTLTRFLSGQCGGAPATKVAVARNMPAAGASKVLPVRLAEAQGKIWAKAQNRSFSARLAENQLNVVVLRADLMCQSIDLSLVRLLREPGCQPLILFINQVDMLADPVCDLPFLRARIADLIQRHNGNRLPPMVVFGSLIWADAAQSGRLSALSDASKDCLLAMAEIADVAGNDHAPSFVWTLSGLPELMDCIGRALEQSPLRRMLGKIRRHVQTMLSELDIEQRGMAQGLDPSLAIQLSVAEVTHRADALSKRLLADLDSQLEDLVTQVQGRINRVCSDYSDASLAEMRQVLQGTVDPDSWDIDPFRVRLQLRSACLGFAQACRGLTDRILRRAARDFGVLSRDLLGSDTGLATPEMSVGAFLSMRGPDLHGTALGLPEGSWAWQPRPGQARAAQLREFRSHLNVKIAALLAEAEQRQIIMPTGAIRTRLQVFLEQQSHSLIALAASGPVTASDWRTLLQSRGMIEPGPPL